MYWYDYIAATAIGIQLFFLLQAWNNYRFNLVKFGKPRLWCELRTLVIVPCKGLDENFDQNIASFYDQDYDNFLLWFVVEDEGDAAYERLHALKDKLSERSKAQGVRILVAGKAMSSGQKVHNLLYCYRNAPKDVDALAFGDSDACLRATWLRHLLWPLRQDRYGAATGYRWFVPRRNNLASLALSSMNAKVAQLLGNTPFNQAWGGSMAITIETFEKIGLEGMWEHALSDDLSLTYAVKKAGMKLAFIPACIVATHESTNWSGLLEFGRRQFLITRITRPGTWVFGLVSSLFSVIGLWGGLIAAIYAASVGAERFWLYAAVPATFVLCQIVRALVRQRMIGKMLEAYRDQMRAAAWADIGLSWLWSILMLGLIVSSAFGRTIQWRGIRYRLMGPTQTERLN